MINTTYDDGLLKRSRCTLTAELYAELSRPAERIRLPADRQLWAESLRLWMLLYGEMVEAITDRNKDRFRRLVRSMCLAHTRLMRRWDALETQPAIALGRYIIPAWSTGGATRICVGTYACGLKGEGPLNTAIG